MGQYNASVQVRVSTKLLGDMLLWSSMRRSGTTTVMKTKSSYSTSPENFPGLVSSAVVWGNRL